MPRRQFIADLQQTKTGVLPPGIDNLRSGEDDGQIVFSYANDVLTESVAITAMISDVSEYPNSHEYMLFCSDDAPKQLADKLQSLTHIDGKTVLQMLDIVSGSLSCVTSGASSNGSVPSLAADEDFGYSEDEDDYMEDDDAFLTDSPSHNKQTRAESKQSSLGSASTGFNGTTRDYRNRIRHDLRSVKSAGSRVSIFGNILGAADCYVIISIRVFKLGISQEAMQAWQLHPEEYLMLVIHYPAGYQPLEQIESTHKPKQNVLFGMRVLCSVTHKPLLQDIIYAFQTAEDERRRYQDQDDRERGAACSVRNTFLSKPLNSLLESYLVEVLRFRSGGMTWLGAEIFLHDLQEGKVGEKAREAEARHFASEPCDHVLPAIVKDDHFTALGVKHLSFPLLATQYMLRHFVRCIEFCLVCHRKIESNIEAIKPYVCNRPLCLFQYISLGFGPSIEHEIQAQPWVVDLLVSFCYSSAAARKLQELPTGLGISVPGQAQDSIRRWADSTVASYADPRLEDSRPAPISKEFKVGFDSDRLELLFFEKQAGGCPVSKGQWIIIKAGFTTTGGAKELHCRVKDTSFYPTITIDEPVEIANDWIRPNESYASGKGKPVKAEATTVATKWKPVTFFRYDQDIDDLNYSSKCQAICRLLDLLPPIKEMSAWLDRSPHNDLRRWSDRIPQSTLNLLRWIVASNRACIMQVDGIPATTDHEGNEIRKAFKQDRLFGMEDHVQFRFAMGAPDKEERFLAAVRETTERLNLKYPTIFAWHGSPLYNWHTIIREGLHFKRADNGRAYGDGVYHARDVKVSLGYSHGLGFPGRNSGASPLAWGNSCLKISSALALNELVNAPAEFTSSAPYYVVQQLDWIQTRYLLVKCSTNTPLPPEVAPKSEHPQDPDRTPTGNRGKIKIPASAIKSGRGRNAIKQNKKLKGSSGNPIVLDADEEYESEESSAEDREILQEEIEPTSQPHSQILPLVGSKVPKTAEDFEPNVLDYKTLPLMPTPSYATSATTRRLMGELASMQKVLNTTEPSELGWHIDLEKTDNVYQWIVELHSFHKLEVNGRRLPLADDMAQKQIKSVVLEIRFGHDFPYSPPYVRVVRPRFKTFNEGGGGHVVMGGAMCMELLTNSGWSGINSMESVLLQVRLAIASEPFARLDTRLGGDYNTMEAAEGFIRACRAHGWVEPPGFKELAYGITRE